MISSTSSYSGFFLSVQDIFFYIYSNARQHIFQLGCRFTKRRLPTVCMLYRVRNEDDEAPVPVKVPVDENIADCSAKYRIKFFFIEFFFFKKALR